MLVDVAIKMSIKELHRRYRHKTLSRFVLFSNIYTNFLGQIFGSYTMSYEIKKKIICDL
jgi:hypothetical protein